MIDRGACLGPAYVAGYGRVTVYHHVRKADVLIVLTNRDEWKTVTRDRVTFVKGKHHGKKD